MEKKTNKIKLNDQILHLQEDLVHHILSFLPLKDLVRTSILSKQWEKIWIIACGTLQFGSQLFKRTNFYKASEEEINAKRDELMKFVERTLHSCYMQMVSINNLELSLPFYNSKTATFLDRCISHAIECNVRGLEIGIRGGLYNLPKTVLAAKSITELSLRGCSLESSSCSNINMPYLKTLRLFGVCLGDHTIQNLLANFPVIEKFTLCGYCSTSKGTLKNFSLVNPKLVMVDIQYCDFERVEIEAMGLQSFSFADNWDSSWSTPCDFNIFSCKNMRKLELQGDTISEKIISYLLSKLCLLETLTLSFCNKWKTIKISSCRLKELVVHRCKKLVKVEIDGVNLTSFDYQGKNVISFSSNGSALSRADISIYPIARHVDNTWYVKLTEFLGKLNNSKVLKLHSTSYKNVIFPKEFREFLVPPLYNVEHLILASNRPLSSEAVEEIVDGLLWFSLHPVTLSIPFKSFFKNKKGTLGLTFIYTKEINKGGNPCCCSSLPIKCWRHSLAEIKIECAEGVDDEEKKNIQSMLDTEILKKTGGVTNSVS